MRIATIDLILRAAEGRVSTDEVRSFRCPADEKTARQTRRAEKLGGVLLV
jgi:hypothetical protein